MLPFIISLGFLILVHEWGHFIVARLNGIFIDEFSIGFGPKLIAKKWGSTLYKICLLPLGGYVKMKGESSEDQSEEVVNAPDSFAAKSIPRRLSVILAGPTMNIIMCFLLMPAALMVGVHEMSMEDGPAVVGQVVPGGPADIAGLVSGDKIVALQSQPIAGWNGFVDSVQKQGWLPLSLRIQRASETLDLVLISQYDSSAKRHMIGIQRGDIPTELKRYPPLQAITMGFEECVGLTKMTFSILGRLFSGDLSYKSLSGPLGIAKMSSVVAKKGVGDFLHFMAFLSLQLGILNLLPIPVLDGGHVVFLGIEAVRRRPLSVKFRGMAQMVGVALLLTLMLAVTINDANTFFGLKTWLAKFF